MSPACDHCYARTLAARFGWKWGADAPRRFFGEAHWREPLRWNERAQRAGQRARVFCASMADVFEILPEGHADAAQMEAARADLWALIQGTPWLDWQLLTKRPKNILRLVPAGWTQSGHLCGGWPANAWAGCTVENQEWAEKRIPHLLEVPAPVRFLSCEPLLGPLDLTPYLYPHFAADDPRHFPRRNGVDWVIAGGESGHGARPSHPDWFRSLRSQCQTAGVPYFLKQWGEYGPVEPSHRPCVTRVAGDDIVGLARIGKKAAGRTLDGRDWNEFPKPA